MGAETGLAQRPEQAAEFLVHFGLAADKCNLVVADSALRRDGDIMRTRPVPVPMDAQVDLYTPAGGGGKLALTAAGIGKLLSAAQARVHVNRLTLPLEQQKTGDVAYEAEVRIRNADGSERIATARYDWIAADQREVARKRGAKAKEPNDGQAEYDKAYEYRDGLAQKKAINRAGRNALGLTSVDPKRASLPWVVLRSELNTESPDPVVRQGIVDAVTGMAGRMYGRPPTLGQGSMTVEPAAALPPLEPDPFGPDDDNGDPEPPDEEREGDPMVDPEGFGGPARCDGGCGTLVGEDEAELTHMAGFKDKTYCAGCLVREVKAVKAAARAAETGEAAPAPTPADGEARGPNGRLLCQECGEKELTSKGQDWVLEQREAGRDPKVRCYQCGQKRGAA